MERYVSQEALKAFFKGRNRDLFNVDTICSIIDLVPDEDCIKVGGEEIEYNPVEYTEIVDRIQMMDNMNKVWFLDEKGPGGGYHEYMVTNGRTGFLIADLIFQKGPRKEKGSTQGVLDTDLLEIVRHRLAAFSKGDLPDENTELALSAVELALIYLSRRTRDRKTRGVLGTMEK